MNWSIDDLVDTLAALRVRHGDTTSVEVKRAAGGVPAMPETICAFANMPNGGTIILGVHEAGGAFEVTGLSDVSAVEAGIVTQTRAAVTPSPQLVPQEFMVDGKQVLVVHVAPLRLADKPATWRGQAYLRQSDGDYVMHPHELRMLDVARLHADERVDYDLKPAVGTSVDDLVPELVHGYVHAVQERDRRLRDRPDAEILRRTSVLTASGEPTLAGLYALGDYPQGQFPALTVTAAVQVRGGEGQPRNRNLEDFTGPVPVMLKDLMGWVRRNLGTEQVYRSDGHMERQAELPLTAIRELLANALVHRDLGPDTLGAGKSIQVRLDERKLLIQSPGGLRGVSLAQLESDDHAQAAVNQRLYQIAKKLTTSDGASVIEGEGGGIREVFQAAEARGLDRPHLIDTGVQFTALLWRGRDDGADHRPEHPLDVTESVMTEETPASMPRSSAPTRHEAAVLNTLGRVGAASLQQLAAETELSERQVRYALRLPIEEGHVVMFGGRGRRDTRYQLAEG